MSDLQTRLAEVMQAMHWEHADLVRVSKQSSSVVSQWLGKGSKTKIIKTIGKLEAAIYIERASGFSALWVAKNLGPKRVGSFSPQALGVGEPSLMPYLTPARLLEELGGMLKAAPPVCLPVLASNLSGWALSGGADEWLPALKATFVVEPTKLQLSA